MKNPPIDIIYQDEGLLVINKPAGVIVNASETHSQISLQDWFEENFLAQVKSTRQALGHLYGQEREDAEEFLGRLGMVHRLDKDTSGVMLWAKNYQVFKLLLLGFKEKTIQKQYVSLVHGRFTEKEGKITLPLARIPQKRYKFGVVTGGRLTETSYVVERYLESNSKHYQAGLSLVRLFPKTGRTHQLRVVLNHLHHPIVGDHLYVGRKRYKIDKLWCQRQFLHSQTISFAHPITNQACSFTAPLSSDLQQALTAFHNEYQNPS